MKKALNITIGKCLFSIEEDAYEALDGYLRSIKKYFGTLPDRNEILEDMEARIAEHFQARADAGQNVIITKVDVDHLISVMGKVEDFGENREEPTRAETPPASADMPRRRLLRDPDNKFLFGVCGGLGAYFNVDPVLFRIAFVVTTFLWGWGILLYLILWLVTPEATSSIDKMEMRGKPITVASLKEEIREVAERHRDDVGTASSALRKLFNAVGSVLTFIFKKFVPALAKLIAFLLVGIFSIVLLALTSALATALVNADTPYIDLPLIQIIGTATFYSLLFAIFFALFIPAIFLFFTSLAVVRKKTVMPKGGGLVLFALWILAVAVGGALAVRAVPQIRSAIESHPYSAPSTRLYEIENFTGIHTSELIRATVVEGDVFEVRAHGTETALDNLSLTVESGVLTITNGRPKQRECLICFISPPTLSLEITAPHIDSLTAYDISRITATLNSAGSIRLEAEDNARIDANVTGATSTTIIASDIARATVTGTTTTLIAEADGLARIVASGLMSANANIIAKDHARVHVSVTEKLKAVASELSRIEYAGDPQLETDIRDHARIEKSVD